MTYNVLRERWIRARRRSGALGWLAPWELTDRWEEDPWVEVATPRPDWDTAIVQFWIGLMQTVCMPEDEEAWEDWDDEPPSCDVLKARFEEVAYAFELISGGGGPALLQPLGGVALTKAKAKTNRRPAVSLCLDRPQPKSNKDWFVKFEAGGLSFEAAATALIAYQVNAPSGGRGYRTSVRGGGPLTTLVMGDSLWETVWANVVEGERWWAKHTPPPEGWLEKQESAALAWPWLGGLRSGNTQETHPADGMGLQVFWGMSRRVALELGKGKAKKGSACAVYPGLQAEVATVAELDGGVNYQGAWEHPLSPYVRSKNGESCAKAHGRWVTYAHWCDLTQSRYASAPKDAKTEQKLPEGVTAARAVRRHLERTEHDTEREKARLWVFGFEFDNAKLIDWHEAKMPVWVGPNARGREHVARQAQAMVRCALSAQRSLREAAARVLYGTPKVVTKKVKKKPQRYVTWSMSGAPSGYFKKQRFTEHSDALWRATHRAFFEAIEALHQALGASDEAARFEAAVDVFLEQLHRETMAIFEARNVPGALQGVDAKAVVLAARDLRFATHPNGRLMRKVRHEG